jgi:hypothetical protein
MRWGLLVPQTGERDAEPFEATHTTLFALLCRSRAIRLAATLCAGAFLGLVFGFVLGIAAVAWW